MLCNNGYLFTICICNPLFPMLTWTTYTKRKVYYEMQNIKNVKNANTNFYSMFFVCSVIYETARAITFYQRSCLLKSLKNYFFSCWANLPSKFWSYTVASKTFMFSLRISFRVKVFWIVKNMNLYFSTTIGAAFDVLVL